MFTKLNANGVDMYKEKIKQIRTELKLSAAKMSEKMGVPVRTFVSYENDGRTPSLEFLAQLCKTFNVNANWFLFDYGKMFITRPFKDIDDDVLEVVKNIVKNELDRRGITK